MKKEMMIRLAILLWLVPLVPGGAVAEPEARVRVEVDAAAAEAVLRIADEQGARGSVTDASWSTLIATHGYRDLKRREEALGRAFTDDEFRAFATSDTVLERREALRAALDAWSRYDLEASAGRALRYLPRDARIEAIIYPLIKPKPNSFVHRTDRGPAIFVHIDPEVSGAKFENIVVHELHHIGYRSACGRSTPATPREYARAYAGGFAEGFAMLAAAGDANEHPHATSDAAERAVWERDVAQVGADMRRLEALFLDIAAGRLTAEKEMNARAMSFIATEEVPQGAYYTVGWHMASTIERARGRDAFVALVCDAPAVMALYNEIVGESGPPWSDAVLEALASGGTPAPPAEDAAVPSSR